MRTALPDSLQPSEVDDTIEVIFFEYLLEIHSITDITLIKIWNISKYFFYSIEYSSGAIYKTIEYDYSISSLLECYDPVGSDISESTRDEEYFCISHVLEKFLIDHPYCDTKWPAIPLSLRECILIIVDMDWYLTNRIAMSMHLIDELARIFHTIHSEVYLIDD